MGEHLKKFLVDLASDPDRLSRFEADPSSELKAAALSAEEKAAFLSRDSARIRHALGAASDHNTFVVGIKKLGIKTIQQGIKQIQKGIKQVQQEEKKLQKAAAKKKKGKR